MTVSLERVRMLFDAALQRPAAARHRFLETACQGDGVLRREVEDLLERHEHMGGFLDRPLLGDASRALVDRLTAGELVLRPDDVLGDFRIFGFLAAGGSSDVYEAEQVPLSRLVALKVCRMAGMRSKDRERFQREARQAACLRHPHLVEVFGYGEDRRRGFLYYAMRLVKGRSLAEVLTDAGGRPPSMAEGRELVARFAEVARALGALHDAGLVHRDVKPANVLLEGSDDGTYSGPAVLVDFGMVGPVRPQSSSTVWATPAYAAPEVMLDAGVDARADVFSVGVAMHDMLSGRCPDQRDAPAKGLKPLHLLVPGFDRRLSALVSRVVDPKPARRPRDGNALAAALEDWLGGRRTRVGRSWPFLAAASFACAVLSAVAVFDHRSSLHAAWGRGDLAVVQELVTVPSGLRPLLVPQPIRSVLTGGEQESVEARVLRCMAEHGVDRAHELAAELACRDGLGAHPLLLRFLALGLQGGGVPPLAASRTVALLFLERPARPGTEGVGEVARACSRLMARQPCSLAGQYGISALAGCGSKDDLESLLGVLARQSDERVVEGAETARLTIVAMDGILRRYGDAERIGVEQAAELLRSIDRALDDLGRAWSGLPAPVAGARDALAQSVTVLARRHGRLGVVSPHLGDNLRLRAVAGDRSLHALLANGLDLLPPELHSELAADDPGIRSRLGFVAGGLGDLRLTIAIGLQLLHQPGDGSSAVLRRWYQYSYGFFQALAVRRLGSPRAAPDWRSRLAYREKARGRRATTLTCAHRSATGEDELAAWDLESDPPCRAGSASDIRMRNVGIGVDEYVPDSYYLELTVPDESWIDLPFRLVETGEISIDVAVFLQKGRRSRLPNHGQAVLEIGLADATRRVVLPTGAASRILVPMTALVRAGEYVVHLRLGTESDTTVRVFGVEVLAH